jgi:MoaA/NifB/PqqE/SkfB family radical SAM enzyme
MEGKSMKYVTQGLGTPFKMIASKKAFLCLFRQELQPVHVYLHPTNKCNMGCEFCSFSNREKTDELEMSDIKKFFTKYDESIRAVTITGGGEPLVYEKIKSLVSWLSQRQIDVGLETNGLALCDYFESSMFEELLWCRVSMSNKILNNPVVEYFKRVSEKKECDYSVFYVCSSDTQKDVDALLKIYRNLHDNLIYVKIVHDILVKDDRVEKVKKALCQLPIDKNFFIFQNEPAYTKGSKNCEIWRMRPVVAADGSIYPCGRVHLAKVNSTLCFTDEHKVGNMLDEGVFHKEAFDGTVCDMCYFDNYNQIINARMRGYNHENFI